MENEFSDGPAKKNDARKDSLGELDRMISLKMSLNFVRFVCFI